MSATGGGAGAGRRVLIVGSYPPVPVAGTPVTVAEVRRAWAAGDDVTVVSPRTSAAHLSVPVHGLLAGRRLTNAARVTGLEHLVLVVEDGFPLPSGPLALQGATAAVLVRALRRFSHVRLVRAGAGTVSPLVWDRLAAAAAEVVEAEPGVTAAGVTPLGPPELERGERPRLIAARLARRLLGPGARGRVEAWGRRLRRLSAGPARFRSSG